MAASCSGRGCLANRRQAFEMNLFVHGSSFWNSVYDLLGKCFFHADWRTPANVDCSKNRAAHARGPETRPLAFAILKELREQEGGLLRRPLDLCKLIFLCEFGLRLLRLAAVEPAVDAQ